MAISYQTYTGNGSVTTFPISFDWIYASDVVVTVDGFTRVNGTDYTIVNKNVVFTTAPSTGTVVKVARSSNLASRNVDFVNGSRLDESDLDNSAKQLFYLIQEIKDQTDDLSVKITAAASALIVDGSVTNTKLASDAVTTSKVANGAITPQKLSTGGPSWDTSGNLTATSFAGPLVGNVTGNVSGSAGSCTGNAATATRLISAPAFSAFQTSGAGQSLTAATWVKLNLASEEFDTDNLFNTSLSRFLPTVAGWYQINGVVGTTTSVSFQVAIAKNWSSGAPPTGSKLGGYSTAFSQVVSSVIYLNGTTDYVELLIYSGTASTSNAGSLNTHLSGVLIKPA
jgi:hypothetical protein